MPSHHHTHLLLALTTLIGASAQGIPPERHINAAGSPARSPAGLLTGSLLETPTNSGGGHPTEWVERRAFLMGTAVLLEVQAPTRAQALAASEAALRALEMCEHRLSTYAGREPGELALLNAAGAGQARPISATLAHELRAALNFSDATNGCFSPTLGPLTRAWDLRAGGRVPTTEERMRAVQASNPGGLRLVGHQATRLHARLIVDEGGFGKGAGLDAAQRALEASDAQSARIDLGGQWLIWSALPHENYTTLAIAHPRRRQTPALEIQVRSGSLATSGNSEQAREVSGHFIGHILDPRTGLPAPDFGSMTVLAEAGLAADALSTGLFVMGPRAAVEWSAAQPGVEVVALVEQDGQLAALASAGLRTRLSSCTPELTIEFSECPAATASK